MRTAESKGYRLCDYGAAPTTDCRGLRVLNRKLLQGSPVKSGPGRPAICGAVNYETETGQPMAEIKEETLMPDSKRSRLVYGIFGILLLTLPVLIVSC